MGKINTRNKRNKTIIKLTKKHKNKNKQKGGANNTEDNIDNNQLYIIFTFMTTFLLILGSIKLNKMLLNMWKGRQLLFPKEPELINFIRCHGSTLAGEEVPLPEGINIITVVSSGKKSYDIINISYYKF